VAFGVTDAAEVRLSFRGPLDSADLLAFFAPRAVPRLEELDAGTYRRSLRLTRGGGVVELTPADTHVDARFWLDHAADLPEAIGRSRSIFDLDRDPRPAAAALGQDELVGPLVKASPGRRVPGTPDPHELAVRAVLGQQISLTGAATLAGRLVAEHGEPLGRAIGSVTCLFPSARALARADPSRLRMPRSRSRALQSMAAALASGELSLDDGVDPGRARQQLLDLAGIGPWTTEYIAMRALRDQDAFLPGDLGIRRALAHLGQDGRPAAAARVAERWRPYRAYAFQHLLAVTIPS
jgi:AraC family transcriptional regulator of adaptative response / DNA-3-methyladenine glycosylase II